MTGFAIAAIAIVALYVWWRTTHYNDSPYVQERIKGRNADQQAAIRYLHNEDACLCKKPISDKEYEMLVAKILSANDFRKKALNKIGLDEDQVKEIEPVHFENYLFDKDAETVTKRGADGIWRSSKYQVTWLFFSDTHVYAYQYTFCLDQDGRKERTEEYFYKDVTNFSTVSETKEVPQFDPEQQKNFLVNVDTTEFVITVPGDKFYCSMVQNGYTEASVQGMKAKLREKKN